jgi:hypothetical protein
MERFPETDCSGELRRKLSISAEAIPIEIPAQFLKETNPLATHGIVARRVVISSIPNGLDRRYRITQSKLSLRSLGGTFLATVKLETGHVSIDSTQSSSSRVLSGSGEGIESATVETTSGQVTITRDEKAETSAIQTVVVDLLIMPGDKAVDDDVLNVAELWSAPQRPLPPDALKLQLVPFHHAAGEEVDATIDFTYTLQAAGSEVICSSSTKATLVSNEATRQPLWDIGVATPAGRKKWLALYSPKLGIIRVVFDGAAKANAFVTWMQMTGANNAGQFSLGLVDGTSIDSPPTPADGSTPVSFHPLTAEAMSTLHVGPIGEP